MKYELLSASQPDDSEAAAIGAALAVLLAEESRAGAAMADAAERSQWNDSAKLSQQGLRPTRTGVVPGWPTIERLRRRAAGGFYGVTGM